MHVGISSSHRVRGSLCNSALFFILAGALSAQETLHLRFSNETVPEGGVAHIKLFVTSPQPIASGVIFFRGNPILFGGVADATVFSDNGDAYGSWFAYQHDAVDSIFPGDVRVGFESPSGGVGRSVDVPILEISAKVPSGTHSVMLDLSYSSFSDIQGRKYILDVQPGVLTVGKGTLSLSNVTPGGGILPAGSVLSIQGTGFTSSTTVVIDGVDTASPEFVDPGLVQVALKSPTEIDGKRIRLRNPDGEQAEYWTWLRQPPDLLRGSVPCPQLCRVIFPRNPATAVSWKRDDIPPTTGYGLGLQNANTIPVDITVSGLVPNSGNLRGTTTFSIPAWGSLYVRIWNPPIVNVETNPPIPIRVLGYKFGSYNPSTWVFIPILQVANAAGGLGGSVVAPGEIISIYGPNPGLESPAVLAIDSGGKVATELQGVRVLFDGVPAPLLYVSTWQINAIVPYEAAGKQSTTIRVERDRVTTATLGVPVVSSAPGIFRVLNQDSSDNNPNYPRDGRPAVPGSIIQIFATGEGQTTPAGVTGSVIHGDLRRPVLPVTVTIDGVEVKVLYAGSAPESVAGLFQVNVQVPQNLVPNKLYTGHSILLTIGDRSTQRSIDVQ